MINILVRLAYKFAHLLMQNTLNVYTRQYIQYTIKTRMFRRKIKMFDLSRVWVFQHLRFRVKWPKDKEICATYRECTVYVWHTFYFCKAKHLNTKRGTHRIWENNVKMDRLSVIVKNLNEGQWRVSSQPCLLWSKTFWPIIKFQEPSEQYFHQWRSRCRLRIGQLLKEPSFLGTKGAPEDFERYLFRSIWCDKENGTP